MAEAVAPGPVAGLRPPQPLNVTDTNIAENWRLFRQKWQNYAVITNLHQQPRAYQVGLLLHTIGDEALKIYNGFKFDTADNARTVDEIVQKFEMFAIGEINEMGGWIAKWVASSPCESHGFDSRRRKSVGHRWNL